MLRVRDKTLRDVLRRQVNLYSKYKATVLSHFNITNVVHLYWTLRHTLFTNKPRRLWQMAGIFVVSACNWVEYLRLDICFEWTNENWLNKWMGVIYTCEEHRPMFTLNFSNFTTTVHTFWWTITNSTENVKQFLSGIF